jgi:hypothetical protein
MAKQKKTSLSSKVNKKVNSTFSLKDFKNSKNLGQSNSRFKEQEWIKFPQCVQDEIQIPGYAKGHINLVRGHSNTGKTTLLIEGAIQAQKDGILPVIIMTEMKHDWDHWENMGFQLEKSWNEEEQGWDYNGFFLYADREQLQSIEDVASFIADLLDEQKRGNLPYDLAFVWDSIGSIPCQMSIEKANNSPMWNAGAVSQQFGNFINQQIVLSRKESQPYTNTLIAVNKIWVEPALTPMSQPKMKNKNGDTMFFDASLVFTFGNITSPGTQKIKATKNGKQVEYALKTRITVDKNHVTGINTKGVVVSTVHGFISAEKKSIDSYKKDHAHEWVDILGGIDFDDMIEDDGFDDTNDVVPTVAPTED